MGLVFFFLSVITFSGFRDGLPTFSGYAFQIVHSPFTNINTCSRSPFLYICNESNCINYGLSCLRMLDPSARGAWIRLVFHILYFCGRYSEALWFSGCYTVSGEICYGHNTKVLAGPWIQLCKFSWISLIIIVFWVLWFGLGLNLCHCESSSAFIWSHGNFDKHWGSEYYQVWFVSTCTFSIQLK